MTTNQINYWRLVEDKRANEAKERETNRSNLANEKETYRHNVITEKENARRNDIQQESNYINKAFNEASLNETKRANQARESYNDKSLQYSYYNSGTNLEIAKTNAGVGYANVGLGYANLAETNRANTARESLQNDANVVNMFNAQTSRFKHNFDVQKWDDIGFAGEQAKYFNTVQGTHTSQAQEKKLTTETEYIPMSTWSTALGAASRIINSVKGLKK